MASKKTEIVKAGINDVAVPEEFKKYAGLGLEDMTKDDLKMPRLALAQGLSPQLEEGDPLYIEGLKLGDAFNTLTNEIYGKGPWEVAVVRRDPPRWIEFIPRDEGGGVRDLNVPPDDPRCEWRTVDGDRVPPVATQFYDYVIVFLDSREVIAASFKSTGINQTAKPWNSLMRLRGSDKPLFMGRYRIRCVMTQNSKGKFAALRVDNAGWVEDLDDLKFLASTFESIQDKQLNIDREPGDDAEPASTDKPPF